MARNRLQFGLALLIGFFLLATLFAVLLYSLAPATPAARGPILLTAFIAILIGSLLCILFLLRWLVRPYRQLVGEAERAPVAAHTRKSTDEAQFVLETFQSVVAKLQAQQKELERLGAQASARADSAERFSERIVASVPSGLIAFDGKGHSMVINRPGRALLDVDGNALGQPVRTLLAKLPRLAETVEECLETGRLYRREEIETVTGTGAVRRLGATIAPIDLSPDRGARGALCLLTDITEVTQLREQVALKRNLESLGEMSAGLAHEFKNAIATLHGYAQLIQNLDLDERGRVATVSLLNEVRNLSEMVTAFLNFARPQPLQLEQVLLDELIDECALELGPLFEERKVKLIVEHSPLLSAQPLRSQRLGGESTRETAHRRDAENTEEAQSIEIHADERMLRQALLNLLRNAAEAISEDKSERRVQVSCSSKQDAAHKEWAVVEIKDTGEGIPTTDLQRIFIPFFTTKAKGHGVGLALAHRVITEHGGTLTAGNAPEGGALFTLRLPC
jgi:nitrogen fixation/metabolism regulation signal transduction histidine kinase